MDNRPVKEIIRGNRCLVLADAIVDLISRRQRPFLWRVKVTGKPPHNSVRMYDISAATDDAAAMQGLKLFEKEMSRPLAILQ